MPSFPREFAAWYNGAPVIAVASATDFSKWLNGAPVIQFGTSVFIGSASLDLTSNIATSPTQGVSDAVTLTTASDLVTSTVVGFVSVGALTTASDLASSSTVGWINIAGLNASTGLSGSPRGSSYLTSKSLDVASNIITSQVSGVFVNVNLVASTNLTAHIPILVKSKVTVVEEVK